MNQTLSCLYWTAKSSVNVLFNSVGNDFFVTFFLVAHFPFMTSCMLVDIAKWKNYMFFSNACNSTIQLIYNLLLYVLDFLYLFSLFPTKLKFRSNTNQNILKDVLLGRVRNELSVFLY